MADFQIAFKRTATNEGGYVNRTADRGGETYRGIARNKNPQWEGWALIDARKPAADFPANLEGYAALQEKYEQFFKAEYWDKVQGDQILSQGIANELFDSAVQFGFMTAGFFLQDSLNLLNKNGKLFPDMLTDGKIGPRTLKLTNEFPWPDALLKTMNGFQFMKYVGICRHDSTQEEFFHGWLKRA